MLRIVIDKLDYGLGLTLGYQQDYAWLSSIFYFGYLVAQYPFGFLLQRYRIARVLGCAILAWGIVLITTPACHSFAGMASNRFLLGALEASVNPGFVMIIGMWYRSSEQPLRLESYYCTNGIATMFGGLIGYAVGNIKSGLPRWMYGFLIFGSLSIIAGVWTVLILPDSPSTAKFLTEAEKVVAVERVAENRQGVKNRTFKKAQAWQVLYDPKTWILFVMATAAQVPNSALTSVSTQSMSDGQRLTPILVRFDHRWILRLRYPGYVKVVD